MLQTRLLVSLNFQFGLYPGTFGTEIEGPDESMLKQKGKSGHFGGIGGCDWREGSRNNNRPTRAWNSSGSGGDWGKQRIVEEDLNAAKKGQLLVN